MRAATLRRRPPLTALLFALVLLHAASAASAEEFYVRTAAEYFVWQEFGDDGVRLLRESGTLEGVGIDYRMVLTDRLVLDESAEIFGGWVGYDGSTLGGDQVSTTVGYLGLKLKGDVGRTYSMDGPYSLEPFAGLGIRTWMRRIENGAIVSGRLAGQASQGYTEQWTTLHARLGGRAVVDTSAATKVFAEAGFKLPLYNENTAYLRSTGAGPNVTLNPGRQLSLFAEAGVHFLLPGEHTSISNFKASVFYDGMRFSRSANVAIQGNISYQPESTADIYGLNISFGF